MGFGDKRLEWESHLPILQNASAAKRHRWLTVVLLSGDALPMPINDQIVDADEPERRAFLHEQLGLDASQCRTVVDVTGRTMRIDNRIVEKTLRSQEYLKRTPYVPWAPFALTRAVEIWRQDAVSRQTAKTEQHDYYLAPLTGHREYDGYVAIAHEDVIFNLIPARASYIENLRKGDLIWQTPRLPACVDTCCATILADRQELGKLRAENRELQRKLKAEKERRSKLEHTLTRTKKPGA
jgi:hypothetical protein